MSKRRQPQRLPPPIMSGGESIESETILTEFPGELGLLLWKTVRSVRLWAELPEGDRPHAFGEGAYESRLARLDAVGAPEALGGLLVKAAAVLQPRARATSVARACREIAEWAASRGELATAIEFMQAAAVTLPANAELAHEVGRLARTRTEYTRAETWYRQAISRARIAQDWYEFSRSYIGLGKIFILRGSYPQAKRSLIRGLRAAKRFSIRPLAARAYHDLMVLAIEADRLSEATSLARSALSAYGVGDRRLPALAHDYGVYLMEAGHFDAALRTFLACPKGFGEPKDQLARAAAVVRAAGAVADEPNFRTAWSDAEFLLKEEAAGPSAGAALIAMTQGAGAMGEIDLALETARRAREHSVANSEFAHEHLADSLLESLGRAAAARAAVKETLRPMPEGVAGAVEAFETAMAGLRTSNESAALANV